MDVSTIAAKAADYRPAKALLTAVAVPFYVLGIAVALVWIALTWCVAAGQHGYVTARDRVRPDDVEA